MTMRRKNLSSKSFIAKNSDTAILVINNNIVATVFDGWEFAVFDNCRYTTTTLARINELREYEGLEPITMDVLRNSRIHAVDYVFDRDFLANFYYFCTWKYEG